MVIASQDPQATPGPIVTRDPANVTAPTILPDGGGMGVVVDATAGRHPYEKDRGDDGNVVQRDEPYDISEERKALVSKINGDVKRAKAHWDKAFKRMQADMQFAAGNQWGTPGEHTPKPEVDTNKDPDPRYVANITLRHIQQKVAALYARNPKVRAKRRQRIIAKLWDGTQPQVMMAMQLLQQNPMNPKAMQIVTDYNATLEYNQMMDRLAKTVEILYEYQVSEQDFPFKSGMKRMVRRALTCGVGYVKLGFQRFMKENPEVTAQIADYSNRLATLERLSADVADDQIHEGDAEMESLKLLIADLRHEDEIVAREGLIFSYPSPTSIIPDTDCLDLNGFLGSTWVAEEMPLSPEKIQEVYGKDVKAHYTQYAPDDRSDTATAAIRARISGDGSVNHGANGNKAMVWQVWNRAEGLVYTLCDGYCDFLEEPRSPDAWTERFWPWFALTLNDLENDGQLFPPSDVTMIRDPQREINRSREGLREHRVSNRPKIAVAAGRLDEEDIAKLENHPANAVLELNALEPGQKVDDLLQPIKMPGIDPNLYDVSPAFQDIERVVGVQEANLGGTSDSTATESSIAESSRQTQLASNVDDLNMLLSNLARTGGQIMFSQFQLSTVQLICGEGAVWPTLSREQVAQEINLAIDAGSTGKPNQAQEIANAEKLVPLILQIPNVNPEWVLEQVIRRLDDSIDMSQAFSQGMPSITAMNSGMPLQPPGMPGEPANVNGAGGPAEPTSGLPGVGTGPATDPTAQAGAGIFNGPAPPMPAPNDPMAATRPELRDYSRRAPV